jgi:hypothetical protein
VYPDASDLRNLVSGYDTYLESVAVTEKYQGAIVWDGQVEVFAVEHAPSGAKRCYAWGYEDAGWTHFICVLGIDPIKTATDAVRAAVVAETERAMPV